MFKLDPERWKYNLPFFCMLFDSTVLLVVLPFTFAVNVYATFFLTVNDLVGLFSTTTLSFKPWVEPLIKIESINSLPV